MYLQDKIIIRDDDVLLPSSAFEYPLERFKEVHELICKNSLFLHVPAIICSEIESFSGALEYIQFEMVAGRMNPELHCWKHVDYGKFIEEELIDDLHRCCEWFKTKLNKTPTKFFTPWAGTSELIEKTAKQFSLEVIAGKLNFIEPHKYLDGRYKLKPGCMIAMHWWKTGDVNKLIKLIDEYKSP